VETTITALKLMDTTQKAVHVDVDITSIPVSNNTDPGTISDLSNMGTSKLFLLLIHCTGTPPSLIAGIQVPMIIGFITGFFFLVILICAILVAGER
jgi:hypothetical protein